MIPQVHASHKQALVSIGLYALSCGHWQMVAAITRLMARQGFCHD
jgi:hypothetical protein